KGGREPDLGTPLVVPGDDEGRTGTDLDGKDPVGKVGGRRKEVPLGDLAGGQAPKATLAVDPDDALEVPIEDREAGDAGGWAVTDLPACLIEETQPRLLDRLGVGVLDPLEQAKGRSGEPVDAERRTEELPPV